MSRHLPRQLSTWLIVGMLAVGGIALARGCAHATQVIPQRGWVVVLCWKQPTEQGCAEISTPMQSRVDCQIVAERVKFKLTGARISCQPWEMSR